MTRSIKFGVVAFVARFSNIAGICSWQIWKSQELLAQLMCVIGRARNLTNILDFPPNTFCPMKRTPLDQNTWESIQESSPQGLLEIKISVLLKFSVLCKAFDGFKDFLVISFALSRHQNEC